MNLRYIICFLYLFCLLPSGIYAKDSIGSFKNVALLDSIFEKLYQLEQTNIDKVNIVHVGDSHIQADIFTDVIRQSLQTQFGNGGYGFSFPYKMAKTNGTRYVKYTSDVVWNNRKNVSPVTDIPIGLSGIGLYTDNSNFEIRLKVNPLYSFTKLKTISSNKDRTYSISIPDSEKNVEVITSNNQYEKTYLLSEPTTEAVIVPKGKKSTYNLDGVILENHNKGLIYHSIGVNGVEAKDYNKYPLFFEQLPSLSGDLLIVSFGTNESFGKIETDRFIAEIQTFVDNVKQKNPTITILLMTPPPSLLRRMRLNTYAEEYSKAMLELKDCVVWDLFTKLGGVTAPLKKDFRRFMARDRIHYTQIGYEWQGELFATDFLRAYADYVKNRKN